MINNHIKYKRSVLLDEYSKHLICLPKTKNQTTVKEFIQTSDRIIWSYWNSENLPWVVKLAIKTWKQNQPNDCICFLTPKTLFDFIDKTDLPPSYDSLFAQRQADVIRIVLLEKYGGLWLDSTFLLGDSLDNMWYPKKYDIGCYKANFFTTNEKTPVLENWFISAPKNSPLIKAWKEEFYFGLTFPKSQDYIDYLKSAKLDLQNINGANYLMMHCALLYVISQPNNYTIQCSDASGENNEPLSYLANRNWNSVYATFYLTQNIDSLQKLPETLKLRGNERKVLTYWPYICEKSIISILIEKKDN